MLNFLKYAMILRMSEKKKTTKKNTTSNRTSSKKTTVKQNGTSTKKTTEKKSSTNKNQKPKTSSAKHNYSRKNKKSGGGGLKSVMILVLLVVIGIYLYRGYQIKDCFFNGIKINHMDVRGMTVAEVEEALAQKASNYQLTITGREGATAAITSADIGYGYVSDGTVQAVFNEQNWLFWGLGYLGDKAQEIKKEVTVQMTYDGAALHNLMNSWSFMQTDQQRAPVDAFYTYDGGQYIVCAETPGTAIDANILYEQLVNAVETTASTLDIESTGAYIAPAITSDNQLLQDNVSTLNAYANSTVVHSLPNGDTKAIYPETLRSWLSVNEEGRYFKDENTFASHIHTYVSELNSAINRYNTSDARFYGQDGEWHTVKKYVPHNWELNYDEEYVKLSEELANGANLTREPVYSTRGRSVNDALADTYIEIDLTGQHLWYHQDGAVVLECDITSGTYTDETRRTPEGLHKISYKQRDQILRGAKLPDGTYEYESPVTYWMPFNGGIGIHDASWRDPDVFGGSYYMYSGSHGCINMPTSKAAELYNLVNRGTLVVCYY